MKPSGEEAEALEEIVAKRQKRGKIQDEKPLEEKSILHSDYKTNSFLNDFSVFGFTNFVLILVSDSVDYQGRTFLCPPQDVGVNLKSDTPPDRCFLPKSHIFTWKGHTKGISTVKWFPRSAHLLISGSMDCRVKVSLRTLL